MHKQSPSSSGSPRRCPAYITAAIIWNGVNNLRIAQDVKSDPGAFETTLRGQGFHASRTPRTLAKFQRAWRALKPELPRPKRVLPISLHHYPNLEEYQKQTGLDIAEASMRCLPNGAEISAPLEDLPNPITWRSGSGAPIHETAHALLCPRTGSPGVSPDIRMVPRRDR